MTGQNAHRYDWGHRVIANVDLFNDGTFPGCEDGALLVAKGSPGEVVQVGMHVETNTPVYLVEFSERCVIGCAGDELAPA
jgi:nitrogen fixation protein NifZ